MSHLVSPKSEEVFGNLNNNNSFMKGENISNINFLLSP
jgi:hypothetical protein